MEFELRPLKPDDLDSLVKYANNYDVSKNLSNRFPFPYTQKDGKAFIEFATNNSIDHILAIDLDGECIGTIGLHPEKDIYARNVEIGYWLGQDFWGKGIVSEAVSRIVQIGFERYDVDRIFAKTYGSNIGSQRVLEKCGFKKEAHFEKTIFKNGAYFDDLVFGIRKVDLG